MKYNPKSTYTYQDKGGRFVVLKTYEYNKNCIEQSNNSNIQEINNFNDFFENIISKIKKVN